MHCRFVPPGGWVRLSLPFDRWLSAGLALGKFVSVLSFAQPVPPPQNADRWTENRVLEQFAAQSAYVQELRARVASAEADVVARTRYANPSFTVSREGAGRTEFYQAEQPLLLTGRRTLLKQAGAEFVRATESEGRFGLWEVRSALRQAFYRLVALEKREQLLLAGLRELDRVIEVLLIREREGEGPRLDRLRAERERADLRSELAVARSQTEQTRALVESYLPEGVNVPATNGELVAAMPGASLEEAAQRALAGRLDLRTLQIRREQLRFEQRSAERLKYPDPVIHAGLKRADVAALAPSGGLVDRNANGLVAGLSLPLPVFNKGQGEVARAAAEQERTAAQAALLERQIRMAITGAWRALRIRLDAQHEYEAEAAPMADLVRIATLAYQEGEIGILQLLDAYRAQRLAGLRVLELQALSKEARIELDRVIGEEMVP